MIKQSLLKPVFSFAKFVRDNKYIYINVTIEDNWFSDVDSKSYYSRPGGFGDDVLYITLKGNDAIENYELSQNAEGAFLAGNIKKIKERLFAIIDKKSGLIDYRLMLPLLTNHDHILNEFGVLLKIKHKQLNSIKPLILEYNLKMKIGH